MQFGLILNIQMLQLLSLGLIQNNKFLIHCQNVAQMPNQFELGYLFIGNFLHLEVMAKHIVSNQYPSDRTESYFINVLSYRHTAKCQVGISKALFVIEHKINTLAALLAFDEVLTVANVATIDWNKVNTVLDLHLHTENFKFGSICTMHDRKTESLLAMFEPVILIISAFIVDQLYLVASDVGLISISELIFEFHTYEYDQKPTVHDGVEVEIDGFDDLIFLMLILSDNFYLVLFL